MPKSQERRHKEGDKEKEVAMLSRLSREKNRDEPEKKGAVMNAWPCQSVR